MTNKEFIDTVTVCKGINTLKDKTHINRIYNSGANVELMLNWWLKQEILEDVMVLKLIEALLNIDNGSIGNLERQLIRLLDNFSKHIEKRSYIWMVHNLITRLSKTTEYHKALDVIKICKVHWVVQDSIIRVNDNYYVACEKGTYKGMGYLKLNVDFEENIGIMTLSKDKVAIIKVEELDLDKKKKLIKNLIDNDSIDLILTCYNGET